MGSKLPWLKWHAGDWLKDPAVTLLRPATRGIWMDALSAMHELDQCGQLKGSVSDLARVCRATSGEMRAALDDLKLRNAADVHEQTPLGPVTNGATVVTLTNRRMRKEWEARKSHARRQKEYKARKGDTAGDGRVTLRCQGEPRSQRPDNNTAADRPPPSRPAPEVVVVEPAADPPPEPPDRPPADPVVVALLRGLGVSNAVAEELGGSATPLRVQELADAGRRRVERRQIKPDQLPGFVVAGIRDGFVVTGGAVEKARPPDERVRTVREAAARSDAGRRVEAEQLAAAERIEVERLRSLPPGRLAELTAAVLAGVSDFLRPRLERADPLTNVTLRALLMERIEPAK